MSIKSFLRRLFPSYRAKDAIEADMHYYYSQLMNKMELLEQKNEYLFFCLQHLEGETELETKKRVFMNLPKASGETADFQFAANYILSRVKQICDENGITFALCGGTALGAVRHGGFIPWDDDVDIDMMRADFNRLQELLSMDEELVMKRYYKYRFAGTEAGHLTRIKLRQSDQFFIDVFPLDYMLIEDGREEAAWKEKETLCEEYTKKLQELFDRHGFRYNGTELAEAVPEMDAEVDALEKEYLQIYENRFLADGRHTHFSRGVGVGRWLRSIYYVKKAEDYLPFEQDALTFEGKQYGAYKNYEELLRYQYGDFWTLPNVICQKHDYEHVTFSQTDSMLLEEIRRKKTQ